VKRFTLAVTGLSLAGTALGCSDKGASPAVEQEQSPIVHGQLSRESDNAVVYFVSNGAGCSGTLIAPNVVLTALHCVSEFDVTSPFRCKADGSLDPTSSGGELGPLLDPGDVSVRVGVDVGTTPVRAKALFGTGSDTVCHDDIAVAVLERAPDIGDAPLVHVRFGPSKRGESTRIVGYGSTYGTSTVNGRQERINVPVIGVGPSEVSGAGDARIAPRTIKVGEGPCQGDSGGPLLSEETGAQLGLYSLLLSNTCVGPDVQNVYTEVAPFESMIREALATAGEEPLVEPPPATGVGGGAGATGEGGEPGVAGRAGEGGAPGEAGAPSETGGTGGTAARGGSGGTGGSGAVAGTSSDGTGGSGATGGGPTTPQGKGSGSRDDGSCALQTGGSPGSGSRALMLFALAALSLVRRRRR